MWTKPKSETLEAMRVNTAALGLATSEAERRPLLASLGIDAVDRDGLFHLLDNHPQATDFGQEIIAAALASGLHLQSYLFDTYWGDTGTISAFNDPATGRSASSAPCWYQEPVQSCGRR